MESRWREEEAQAFDGDVGSCVYCTRLIGSDPSLVLHGGDRETSLMLHFRPETVDMTKAVDFPSSAEHTAIPPIGPLSYGWVASDLNPEGTVGEAHLASAEKGKATCDHQVTAFIALLCQVRDRALGGLSPTNDGPR